MNFRRQKCQLITRTPSVNQVNHVEAQNVASTTLSVILHLLHNFSILRCLLFFISTFPKFVAPCSHNYVPQTRKFVTGVGED